MNLEVLDKLHSYIVLAGVAVSMAIVQREIDMKAMTVQLLVP